MEKIIFFILITTLSLLFYLVIPYAGTFVARRNWKIFRKNLIRTSLFPLLEYSHLKTQMPEAESFRFFGKIEAIQGNNRIWVNNGSFSVAVMLEDLYIYTLPSPTNQEDGELESNLQNIDPLIMKWENLFSIPEGTRVFIGGSFFREKTRGVFKNEKNNPLMVIIFDEKEEDILNKAIWSGRQKNEYWNQFTLISLLTGCFILYIITYFLLQSPVLKELAVLALTFGVCPLAVFLPPGLILLFFNRRLWRNARLVNAGKDLLLLPLRYFLNSPKTLTSSKSSIILLPDKTKYIMHRGTLEENMKLIRPKDRVNIRKCYQPPNSNPSESETYLFGAYMERDDGGFYITKPRDPMAELVLIPGNPEKIAENCKKKFLSNAIIATALLIAAVCANFSLVYFLLNYFF